MAGFKVGYLVGSLATKSINRLLAKALVRAAPPELQLTEISFKDLPLYSYDHDGNYPRWRRRSRTPSQRWTPCYS
jgi:chromate reductase, NAD(P)H dehydrogenase (quinone)